MSLKATGSPASLPDARVLWLRVEAAREAVAHERLAPRGQASSSARRALLDELEAYAACLTLSGRPIPYTMRDELNLLRLTCANDLYPGGHRRP